MFKYLRVYRNRTHPCHFPEPFNFFFADDTIFRPRTSSSIAKNMTKTTGGMKQRFKDQKLFKDLENQTSIKLALSHRGLKGET